MMLKQVWQNSKQKRWNKKLKGPKWNKNGHLLDKNWAWWWRQQKGDDNKVGDDDNEGDEDNEREDNEGNEDFEGHDDNNQVHDNNESDKNSWASIFSQSQFDR